MGIVLTYIAYLVCVIFLGRFILHAFSWFMGVRQSSVRRGVIKKMSLLKGIQALLDLLLLRRLFKTNKILWIASWTFHLCFVLILLRHAWYFMDHVPEFIILMEPAGITSGYILPFSLLLLLVTKITAHRDRYISNYNLFIVTVLFMTSLTGLLMGIFFEPDVMDVKEFIAGILMIQPAPLPESSFFIVHFLLVLLLVPNIPFHLFTAPIISIEAKRREEGLDLVMHEK
jgi:nitrate reductase gamma subunit